MKKNFLLSILFSMLMFTSIHLSAQILKTTDGLLSNNSASLDEIDGSWKPFTDMLEPQFECGMKLTDVRDGKIYNTIQIGTQCWMAQNMNIGDMIRGTLNQANNSIREKYCYDDLQSNCDVYGGLYQWEEAMQYDSTSGKGICPEGWHISTDADWTSLTDYLGGQNVETANKMKEAGKIHWAKPNKGATNSSGFTALPGGMRVVLFSGGFIGINEVAAFWSPSTQAGYSEVSWVLGFSHDVTRTSSTTKTPQYGRSVRCVKN